MPTTWYPCSEMCQLCRGRSGIACHSVDERRRGAASCTTRRRLPGRSPPKLSMVPQLNVAGSPFASTNGITASEPPGTGSCRSHSWMRFGPSAGRSTTIAISGSPSPSMSGVANGSHPVGHGERTADRVRLPVAVQIGDQELGRRPGRGAVGRSLHLRRHRDASIVSVPVEVGRASSGRRIRGIPSRYRPVRRWRRGRCTREGRRPDRRCSGAVVERVREERRSRRRPASDHDDRERAVADASRRMSSARDGRRFVRRRRRVGRPRRALQLVASGDHPSAT